MPFLSSEEILLMGISPKEPKWIREAPYFLELRDAFGYREGGECFCRSCLRNYPHRVLFVDCLGVLLGHKKLTKRLMQKFMPKAPATMDSIMWHRSARDGFVKLLCLKQARGITNGDAVHS